MRVKRFRSNFTSGQLLVSGAIMGLLSVVLLPVLTQAQEQGRTQQCLDNLRQVGKAHLQYAADWNETFLCDDPALPPWVGFRGTDMLVTPKQGTPQAQYRAGLLDPYLKDENVKACPNRPKGVQLVMAINGWYSHSSNPFGAKEYGPFLKRNADRFSPITYIGVKLSEVSNQAETFLVWEHYTNALYCTVLQYDNWCKQFPTTSTNLAHLGELHKEGGSVLFADGHSKSLPLEKHRRFYYGVDKSVYSTPACQ